MSLFGSPVSNYALLYGVGALALLPLLLLLGRARGLPPRPLLDGLVVAAFAAVAGGQLWYAVAGYGRWLSGGTALTGMPGGGGSASFGGLFGMMLATGLYVRLHPALRGRLPEVLDLAPVLPFAFVFARLGCFAIGCCHGRPAFGLPWAVVFPENSPACVYRGIPVHPVQLYEAAGCALILAVLLALFRSPAWRGTLLAWFLGLYGALRFATEFFRGDGRPAAGPLSLNQWICLGLVAAAAAWLARHVRAMRAAVGSSPGTAPPERDAVPPWIAALLFVSLCLAGRAFNAGHSDAGAVFAAIAILPILGSLVRPGFQTLELRRDGWAAAAAVAVAALAVPAAVGWIFLHLDRGAMVLLPSRASLLDWWGRSGAMLVPLAFVEEVFFRGWIQQGVLAPRLGAWRWGPLTAPNLAASVAFGAAHVVAGASPFGLVAAGAGLLMGWVMERSGGSVWPAVALHAVLNVGAGVAGGAAWLNGIG